MKEKFENFIITTKGKIFFVFTIVIFTFVITMGTQTFINNYSDSADANSNGIEYYDSKDFDYVHEINRNIDSFYEVARMTIDGINELSNEQNSSFGYMQIEASIGYMKVFNDKLSEMSDKGLVPEEFEEVHDIFLKSVNHTKDYGEMVLKSHDEDKTVFIYGSTALFDLSNTYMKFADELSKHDEFKETE